MLIASIPCVLGFNLWSGFEWMPGKNVLDLEDSIVSNVLLPLGSLIFLVFCVTKYGWGLDNYLEECNTGKGMKMPRAFRHYFRYVLPVLILVIFVSGLWSFFK